MPGDWKPGETPFCEIESVAYPNHPGNPIRINLSARGAREARRREEEKKRQPPEVTPGCPGLPLSFFFNNDFV